MFWLTILFLLQPIIIKYMASKRSVFNLLINFHLIRLFAILKNLNFCSFSL